MANAFDSMAMESHIALVRHARSAYVHDGWVDADGFRAWREAYEAAGIGDDERIPTELKHLTNHADVVISSDAARAIATARLMAVGGEVFISPLVRELDLEAPNLGRIRLPLRAWALAVGARMLALSLRRQYPSSAEAARINDAAVWLEKLAGTHRQISVVTHAMFRKRLAARLVEMGWEFQPGKRSLAPWSVWGMRRAGVHSATTGRGFLAATQASHSFEGGP
jgi:broad specificity phosphatase PhoE